MSYRTVNINWLPRTPTQWAAFTASRAEAARLWSDLVERHYRIRRANLKWPSKNRWFKWAKGRYPNLHSQSVQQIIAEFCEAVASARALRKNGNTEAKYPWRRSKYHDVIYTNQAVRLKNGYLIFPNGKSGDLCVRLPKSLIFSGRTMEARLKFGELQIICETNDAIKPLGPTIGVDLGVNTIVAATDGQSALLVSGRDAKATIQWRAKNLAAIESCLSSLQRGSRKWNKLQHRKHKMLRKADNRMKDLTHKATRRVVDAFPNARCYIGKPFNDGARKMRRKQAQQVSSVCNAKLIAQLDYKTSGAIQVEEAYSSQTCPVCGVRNKCARVYHCKVCSVKAPRDVIGALNILCIGQHDTMIPGRSISNAVRWVHPIKYPGRRPGSSGGHPASSLAVGQEVMGL